MICYRQKCERKDECDKFVAAACIYRINKEQVKVKLSIKNICNDCLSPMVKARYRNKEIMLCTTCNNVLKDLQTEMSKGA